ncbi:hypothetical protein ACFPJ4_01460 [Lysinimonas soli]|uniref:Uncharacterized protein n=1 Tax=Lysinimonas soli TaxID=1074233 RepID=A0ABW0NKG6_9MICO
MSDEEYHPELAEYVPGRGSSLRHPVARRVLRIVIVIGIAGLILPGVISTIGMQVQTADAACRIVVAARDPQAVAAEVRLEAWGSNGPGWYCYARAFDGTEIMLRPLGLIPGLSYRPSGTPA